MTLGINRKFHKSKVFRLFLHSLPLGMVVTCLMLSSSACDDPQFIRGDEVNVTVSSDTVLFDTVFTTFGSITKSIKVYNPLNDAVIIDRVYLESPNSFFRLNVDGIDSSSVEDVIIWPNDSIYIFIEVTIDPDQPVSVSPFIITDKMHIVSGEMDTEVHLEAWGQNANYFPSKANKNNIALLSCDLGEVNWDDPKPYIIYGIVIVDSCTLNIPAGTKVYFHGSLANNTLGIYQEGILFTFSEGRLNVEGTAEDPVLFASDRLEPSFANVSGQWPGLRIGAGSRGNKFKHAIIQQSQLALRVDSAAQVELDAVEVRYASAVGIQAIHADVSAKNCLIHNTGAFSYQQAFGGSLNLEYCSFASYGNTAEAIVMNNFFCYDPPICSKVGYNPMTATLTNCIFDGNERDEIGLFDATDDPGDFDFVFDHCLVKVDELLDEDGFPDFFDHCINCIKIEFGDRVFEAPYEDNFNLDSLSIAIEKAKPIPGISTDILENPRSPVTPDVGCYERND